MTATDLDALRRGALDRIERSERRLRGAYVCAAVLELAFLAGFVGLADFSERTHVLILLAAIGTYTLLALGLIALSSHTTRNVQLVLQAIVLLDDRR